MSSLWLFPGARGASAARLRAGDEGDAASLSDEAMFAGADGPTTRAALYAKAGRHGGARVDTKRVRGQERTQTIARMRIGAMERQVSGASRAGVHSRRAGGAF